MLTEIEKILDRDVRPFLSQHGGDISSVSCENGIYRFRLLNQCSGCPSAYLTTEGLIKEALLSSVPGLKQVVLEQSVSDDLIAQALAILRHE